MLFMYLVLQSCMSEETVANLVATQLTGFDTNLAISFCFSKVKWTFVVLVS